MSSTPKETETHDVDLTREQSWVVHHALVDRADDAIDDGDQPAPWLLDLVDRIESDEGTITARQARNLAEVLEAYVADEQTPETDLDPATTVSEELSALVG